MEHFFMLTVPCYHYTFGYFVFIVLCFFTYVCFLFSLVMAVACRFVFPIFLLFPLCPASLPVLLPPHQFYLHIFLLPSFGLPLKKLLPKSFLKHWRVSCLCTLPLSASIDAPACLPSLSVLYVIVNFLTNEQLLPMNTSRHHEYDSYRKHFCNKAFKGK